MRLHDYAPRPAHIKWLLDSDPAIRWQVMRDLTGEAPNAIAAERSRVATEGWGAQLLALQSPAGNWGGPNEDRGLLITLYTLVVLKDLGLDPASTEARKRAENYLLERRMFRSLRTGEVINKRWLRFSFPTFWHYDVLRGLDYLRSAGIKSDSRVSDAIETVIERRHQNGRWPLNLLHPEHIPLEMETGVGRASRWNTLRALRVLRWYNNSTW